MMTIRTSNQTKPVKHTDNSETTPVLIKGGTLGRTVQGTSGVSISENNSMQLHETLFFVN